MPDNESYRIKMNQEVKNAIKRETIAIICRPQRQKWAGHVERIMPDDRHKKDGQVH